MNDMLRQIEPVIPALRRYARALVRNRATADDLVQDCLERAVSHWGQRRDGDPRPWLFTILHNLAVNQFRRSASAASTSPSTRPTKLNSDRTPCRSRS
jgi:RNA polymerase sigma-70 factor (ECF subfamily)